MPVRTLSFVWHHICTEDVNAEAPDSVPTVQRHVQTFFLRMLFLSGNIHIPYNVHRPDWATAVPFPDVICLTNASSVMLGETRWAFTGEPPQGVDTEELAVVLFGLTFVKVWKDREVRENQQGLPSYSSVLMNSWEFAIFHGSIWFTFQLQTVGSTCIWGRAWMCRLSILSVGGSQMGHGG